MRELLFWPQETYGFIDVQTLITQLLSYFRVITNPKAVFLTTDSLSDNTVSDKDAQDRLKTMVDDTLELASKYCKIRMKIKYVFSKKSKQKLIILSRITDNFL